MNDRKLIDYLPPVLQAVLEYVQITAAQQPEFELAWDAINFVMDNQFIDTATEEGVAVWEKELNIVPLNTETLEERKQRIKTAWTYGVVYTYNWLVNWLKTSCGDTRRLPTINDYTLRVALPVSVDYIRILEDMRRYISANVLIDPLILLTKIDMTHYVGAAFRHSVRQTMQTPAWDMDSINLLTDENGIVLMEEAGSKILYEEVVV